MSRAPGFRHFLRRIYYRSGELFTLCMALVIGYYLIASLSGSQEILKYEQQARAMVETIYRCESNCFNSSEPHSFTMLSKIIDRYPALGSLRKSGLQDRDESELYTDDHYLYFFTIEYELQSTESYLSGQSNDSPSGFKVLAWPVRFAETGEIAFYIDDRGMLGENANSRASFDGTKNFPPELEPITEEVRKNENIRDDIRWTTHRVN